MFDILLFANPHDASPCSCKGKEQSRCQKCGCGKKDCGCQKKEDCQKNEGCKRKPS